MGGRGAPTHNKKSLVLFRRHSLDRTTANSVNYRVSRMTVLNFLGEFHFQLDTATQRVLILFGIRLCILIVCIVISLFLGPLIPRLAHTVFRWISLSEKRFQDLTDVLKSIEKPLSIAFQLIFVSISLNILGSHQGVYLVLSFIVDAGVTISLAWTISRIAKQLIRLYGLGLLGRIGEEVNDIVLIIENIANFLIGFFAVTIFAQTRDFNFLALLTGLGIGAAGVAFAAQEALGQIIGTIVIYLDRPYMVGEYVRVNFNVNADDAYGRVESIGIRSTKIRLAVSNTLLIVPNSIMASKDIENISRGSKVMVLLYIDFVRPLDQPTEALVTQTVRRSFDGIFGIDPGSTRIHLFQPDDKPGTRARVSFFVMGTSESSLELRKRMLEIASKSLKHELREHELEFSMQEPTVYVESPVTL